MSSVPNNKRRHTRLQIELRATLGFEGGAELDVLTDNLSFSGARFSLRVPKPAEATPNVTAPLVLEDTAPLEALEPAQLPLQSDQPADAESSLLREAELSVPSSTLSVDANQGTLGAVTESEPVALADEHEAHSEAPSVAIPMTPNSLELAEDIGTGDTQDEEIPKLEAVERSEASPRVVNAPLQAMRLQLKENKQSASVIEFEPAVDEQSDSDVLLTEHERPESTPDSALEGDSVISVEEPDAGPLNTLEPLLLPDDIEAPTDNEQEHCLNVSSEEVLVETVVVTPPDDILEWVDITLPDAVEPIRLSVREIRRLDEALMVEFVDSTFTEYTLYKNFLFQRGLESGSDLTGEFDANPHLAENFELEFNNRKLGQILEILYGLTSREVKTAIAEQRQSGRRLGDILIGWGRITKQQLQAAIAVSKSGQDTLFSQFFLKVLPTDIWQRFWQLFGEGATMVLVTLGVMVGLGGIPQGGLISIFLVATALNSRIESILQHQDGRQRGRELLGLFLGLFVGYAAVSILFNSTMIFRMFEVLLNSNGVTDTETLFDRKFHSLLPIMANNLMVLISGCILSFCFRQYGVLLTLVWNACLWGVSLVTLVTQTLDRLQSDLALKVLASTASLMPHLAIEALGYIYAASAAHGISKAVMWGAGARAQQRRAITKYMVQIILGAILIILGAFLESYWVPWSMRTIMLG